MAKPSTTHHNTHARPTREDKIMRLHGYFRSSASWRVRIALNLKGLAAEQTSHHLRRGEQSAPGYVALNPQGWCPPSCSTTAPC